MSVTEEQQTLQQLVKERVALEKQRRLLEAELKSLTTRIDALDPRILDLFVESDIKRINVDGMTVYGRVDRFVSKRKDVATPAMLDALRKAGLADLCSETYSAASLKARVLEWLDAGEQVPEPLAACLNVSEVPRLVALAT